MRLLFATFLCLIQSALFAQGVIPLPQKTDKAVGQINLNQVNCSVEADTEINEFVSNYLEQVILAHYQNKDQQQKLYPINLTFKKLKNPEGYRLTISKDKIEIEGQGAGMFYGIQTLQQLIFQNNGMLDFQVITDEPSFSWRGMHLDVSRHFFKVDFIKKYIDILAIHKMNTFHWHLTDDQGWRIEIKKYPLLTKIGSHRGETIVGKNFDPYKGDGKPYGGFYTQEEIKEVVAYAKERYVTVVPEIEMPGHTVAALGAYPQFSCNEQPLQTLTKWGISDDVFCTKESTFEFVFDILDEVLALFPSKYIHIGGDEVPKTRWKICANCQLVKQEHNLADEHQLQSYFISRVDSFLTSMGRNTIGWDEILEGGLAPNAAVMSWRGEEGGIEAVKQKHNVVMSPGSHCYFDHYQGDKKNEPLAIGGYTPLKKVYAYNPVPESLSKNQAQYILGAQGNVWTEYMETPEHVMYMALPRLCALSEVLWTPPPKKDYVNFRKRLINHFKYLDENKIKYANNLFNLDAKMKTVDGKLLLQLLSDFPDYQIRYTTNEESPTASSQTALPLTVYKNTTVKAQLFDGQKAIGNIFSQEYTVSKSTGKTVTLKYPPSKSYNYGGAQTLVNGVVGSLPWTGNEWLGWKGHDTIEVLVDLGDETKISTIKISFLEAKESWIHLPKKVIFEKDKIYTDLMIKPALIKGKENIYVLENLTNYTRRDLRFYIITEKKILEGNPGAGEKPWLFCSEIIVE